MRPLALGATALAAAAAMLMVLGGGGSGVRGERADAAELSELSALVPHLQLAGPWQIASTEVSPGAGRINYRSEEDSPALFDTDAAEIRWHSGSVAVRGAQLESSGFTFAGPKRIDISRPAAIATEPERYSDVKRAQVYVVRIDGRQLFLAAGLWREGGRTLEYRAFVPNFWVLERLMERIEVLDEEEWLVALQPGGGKWLADSGGGVVKKLERIKVGETAGGRPIYRDSGLLGAPEPGEKLDFKAPLPIVYREGDKVRVVTQQPPKGLEAP